MAAELIRRDKVLFLMREPLAQQLRRRRQVRLWGISGGSFPSAMSQVTRELIISP